MDLSWLRSLLAAPLVCLFMILVVCSLEMSQPHSVGIRVPIVQLPPQPQPEYVCDGESITVWLAKDGTISINHYSQISSRELTAKLAEIFEFRPGPLYVFADHEAPYGQFADLMSKIMSVKEIRPKLQIVLVSGQLRDEVEHYPTFVGFCGLDNWESVRFRDSVLSIEARARAAKLR